ncbi:chromosomal replication initiator protein DnaA [Candidatus Peregrinibacteria bacterium]|nr:chromosomal replication initiator protein DnaA [Candidatus Peregrinibacteria bacterium]
MDYKTLWEDILLKVAPTIGKTAILSLYKDSIIIGFKDGILNIGVPTHITGSFIRERHEVKVLQAAKEVLPEVKNLSFEVKGVLADSEHENKIDLKRFTSLDAKPGFRKVPNKQEVFIEKGIRSKMFNPKYTLENYISGEQNRLVLAACKAVSVKPGGIYNPLFIYGCTGLGKTHLLQGIGLEVMERYPNKKCVYMTSERFINEVIEAIGKKHTKSFKDKYRNVDLFIVDDIQFFGNKASTQQEFFHTFNELYDAGKQIVISSDRAPNDLDGLEDRLTSRFNMGMVVEIQMPDFETRLAILNGKCREHQILIDPEILEFIAYNVSNSVRELVGVLVNVIAETQLTECAPTLKSVAAVIRKLGYSGKEFNMDGGVEERSLAVRSTDDVIEMVARYFKLTITDLTGEDRRKEIMIPRQICMYLIREILNCSYETIGEQFSGRNHTTVLHAVTKIIKQINSDERLKRDVNALKKEMGLN